MIAIQNHNQNTCLSQKSWMYKSTPPYMGFLVKNPPVSVYVP